MRVKFLRDCRISTDGFMLLPVKKDALIDLPDMAARLAIREGKAKSVNRASDCCKMLDKAEFDDLKADMRGPNDA